MSLSSVLEGRSEGAPEACDIPNVPIEDTVCQLEATPCPEGVDDEAPVPEELAEDADGLRAVPSGLIQLTSESDVVVERRDRVLDLLLAELGGPADDIPPLVPDVRTIGVARAVELRVLVVARTDYEVRSRGGQRAKSQN